MIPLGVKRVLKNCIKQNGKETKMKVLQIAVGINGGGVGAVLLNFYTHMNHNDVKFDIIIDDLPSVKNGSLNEDAFKKWAVIFFVLLPNRKI